MSFIISKILQADGTLEAVVDADVSYRRTFNSINTFRITISATAGYDFSKFGTFEISGGSDTNIAHIYRNGVLKVKGPITSMKKDSSGNMILKGVGMEVFARRENVGQNKTYVSQIIATTRTNLVGDISRLNIGTNEAYSGDPLGALDLSGMTYLQALNNITVEHANQDWSATYYDDGTTDELDFEDNKGSSTSVQIFVQGIDVSTTTTDKNIDDIINSVVVVGSGFGVAQITATASDATSITDHGTREPPHPFIFKNITNATSAQDVADQIVAQFKDPTEKISGNIKDVDVVNSSNGEIVPGDVVTIHDPKTDIDRDMRIMAETRETVGGTESLVYTFGETGDRRPPSTIAKTFGDILTRIDNMETYPWEQVTAQRLVINTVGLSPVNPVYIFGAGFTGDGDIVPVEKAAPSTPPAGEGRIYEKTDNLLYFKNDAGTEFDLTAGAVGGSGTTNRIPLWTASTTLGDSFIAQSGGAIVPDTTGRDIGQLASPTWDSLFITQFEVTNAAGETKVSAAGDNLLFDSSAATNVIYSFDNTGAGAAFLQINQSAASPIANLTVNGTGNFSGDLTMNTADIIPATDNTGSVGTASLRWNSINIKRVLSLSADSGSGSKAFEVINAGTGATCTINQTNTGSGNVVQITNAGSGVDIRGNSGNWTIDKNGTATFAGSMTIDGNTTLGNATGDTITATARFNTAIIPDTNARDLGQVASPTWRDCFLAGFCDAVTGFKVNGVQGMDAANIQSSAVTPAKMSNDFVSFRDNSDTTIGANSTTTFTITYGAAFSSTPSSSADIEIMNQTPTGATVRGMAWTMNAAGTASSKAIVDNNNSSAVDVRLHWIAHLEFN